MRWNICARLLECYSEACAHGCPLPFSDEGCLYSKASENRIAVPAVSNAEREKKLRDAALLMLTLTN